MPEAQHNSQTTGPACPQVGAELLPLVYEELRRLAAQKLSRENPSQTLQATALVHEAWLRLLREEDRTWNDPRHFFLAAAEAMRRILVENARRKQSPKHGGHFQRVHPDHPDLACPLPDEQFADVMVDVLDLVRPERRANRLREAVVLREEATEAVWEYMPGQWLPVPGQERWRLNHHARDSFVRMREQARAEGVDLVILSAHRRRQTAQANAARAGNPNAVASFSFHSLGLAIDFRMSHRDGVTEEAAA